MTTDVIPVGYVLDMRVLYSKSTFSNIYSSSFYDFDSNSNIANVFGFAHLTKGKYLVKYLLRLKFVKLGTYILGARIVRKRRTAFSSDIIWESTTYKNVVVHEDDQIITVLHSMIFSTYVNFDVNDEIGIYLYITDGSTLTSPTSWISTLYQNACVSLYKIY